MGSWRVVERLGVGGYGAVYRVEDLARPGDFYALKVALRPEDERAEREVQLLMSRAVHPNVVRLHACGRWPHPRTGYLYFVMDWVPGPALHTWVETVNPAFRQLAAKAGTVALALGALHGRGVLHRDFKPEHVLIREGDGEPILLDFGVGRYAGADTVTTAVLPPATVHLLSPEAVHFFRKHYKSRGARYEARAADDLYALGVSLYRVVTGHWPFPPELPPDMLYAVIEGQEPPAPAAFNRRVPRALSELILRLLAKKPEARFQSGQDVHAALVAAVALGGTGEWERTVFEWEDVPGAGREAGGAARRIRRPEGPTAPGTPPPRKLVLGAALPMPWLRGRRFQEAPGPVCVPRAPRPRGHGAAWLAVLVALVALGMWLTQPPRSSVHEVAREVEPSETASAAAPPLAVSTPAAVAAPATHAEVQAAVKTPKTATPTLKSMGKALCLGATAASLACTGGAQRQLLPTPPPESCPPGALEFMKKSGITIGTRTDVNFPETSLEVITVREGYYEMDPVQPLGKLPGDIRLFGRLIIGDTRVYGRFTEVRTRDDERFPICMNLYGTDNKLGLARKPGGGADSARVFSGGTAKAVLRFD